MEKTNTIWVSIVAFLKEYNIPKIAETIRQIEWKNFAGSPVAWAVVLILVAYMVWRRQIRLFVFVASLFLFVLLLQNTLPPAEESMSLDKLLKFVGGCVALISLNAYFLFIRE